MFLLILVTHKKYLLSDTKGPPIPLLVTLRSVMRGAEFTTASREIFVGCVRTMAVSQKKVTPL